MCSVLIILMLLSKVIQDQHFKLEMFHLEELCSMFGMLCLAPHQLDTQWKSEDLDILLNFVPEVAYDEIATCLEEFINSVIEERQLRGPQWLYVLPLIHIFRKKIKPFEKPATTDIQWDDNKIKLSLAKCTSSVRDDTRLAYVSINIYVIQCQCFLFFLM